MTRSTDIAVVGGGPGGYATALRAAVRGLRVTLLEAADVGGTCLHRGCVPSKALLHAAGTVDAVRGAATLGIDVELRGLDRTRMVAGRDSVVAAMHRGLLGLLRARGVEVVAARGTVEDDLQTVTAGDERIRARHVVIATGSRPAVPPGITVDGDVVVTSDTATALPRIPASAVVLGSGAVGLEFASLYRSLGAEVVLVEALDRLAPREDTTVGAALLRSFRRRGIEVVTGHRAEVSVRGDTATVRIGERTVAADTVLVATGRIPASDAAGPAVAAHALDSGHLRVDDHFAVPGTGSLHAVGDLVAPPMPALAHAAFAMGMAVADGIAGVAPPLVVAERIPRVTYCSPEVASVGLTAAEAEARHPGSRVQTVPLAGTARGRILGGEGFVSVVAGPDGSVLGVHIVGPHATELVSEAMLAVGWEARVDEVAALVHPHPTLAEAVGEAHLALAGLPFHLH